MGKKKATIKIEKDKIKKLFEMNKEVMQQNETYFEARKPKLPAKTEVSTRRSRE